MNDAFRYSWSGAELGVEHALATIFSEDDLNHLEPFVLRPGAPTQVVFDAAGDTVRAITKQYRAEALTASFDPKSTRLALRTSPPAAAAPSAAAPFFHSGTLRDGRRIRFVCTESIPGKRKKVMLDDEEVVTPPRVKRLRVHLDDSDDEPASSSPAAAACAAPVAAYSGPYHDGMASRSQRSTVSEHVWTPPNPSYVISAEKHRAAAALRRQQGIVPSEAVRGKAKGDAARNNKLRMKQHLEDSDEEE
jgi:hypothetical protein